MSRRSGVVPTSHERRVSRSAVSGTPASVARVESDSRGCSPGVPAGRGMLAFGARGRRFDSCRGYLSRRCGVIRRTCGPVTVVLRVRCPASASARFVRISGQTGPAREPGGMSIEVRASPAAAAVGADPGRDCNAHGPVVIPVRATGCRWCGRSTPHHVAPGVAPPAPGIRGSLV